MPLDPARLARLDACMHDWVERGAYGGLEWMLGDGAGPLHRGRAGLLDPARPGAGMPERPFHRIYSMTKPLVSLAAMQLIEECRLHLHAPVGRWLPEWAAPQVLRADGTTEPARSPITVIDLMNHSAGLSYAFLADPVAQRYARIASGMRPDLSLQAFAARFAEAPLLHHPGEGWTYSIATDLLGALLERVEDRPLQRILQDRIIDPLGMEETGFRIPVGAQDRLFAIHGGGPGPDGGLKPLDLSRVYPPDRDDWARGGHGLFSTLDDYGRFCAALLRLARGEAAGPVSREGLRMMTADLTPPAARPLRLELPVPSTGPGLGGYGFGLGFRCALPYAGGAQLRRVLAPAGEFGWSGAAETWFSIAPNEGVWALFMAQNLDWPGASGDFQTLVAAALR